jgi:hypothetical protein
MSGSPASRPSTGCGCCCIPGPCRQGCCWPSRLPVAHQPTLANPRLASPGAFDRPELRRIQIPAAGGIGTVRAVARCFGELATGARTLGLTDRTLNELTTAGIPPADGWGDGLGMPNVDGAQEAERTKQLCWPLPPSVLPQVIDTSTPLKAAAASDRLVVSP